MHTGAQQELGIIDLLDNQGDEDVMLARWMDRERGVEVEDSGGRARLALK